MTIEIIAEMPALVEAPLRDIPNVPRGMPDDDAMTVARKLPPPCIFSQRIDRGTPSTMACSTTTLLYEHKPDTPQTLESLLRINTESASSSFVSKDIF